MAIERNPRHVNTLQDLSKALRLNYQYVWRLQAEGVIRPDAHGRFDVEAARAAITTHMARQKHGTFKDTDGRLRAWHLRERRAKAKLAEAELASVSGETVPLVSVRKAWIGWTMLLKENIRNLDRQLGVTFGGKIGLEIEQASRKLHEEMWQRLSADPLLTGANDPPK